MQVFVSHNAVFSNLGFTSNEVVDAIVQEKSGLRIVENPELLSEKFCASFISSEKIKMEFSKISNPKNYTKLEQLMILALKQVIDASGLELTEKIGLIISTTKGNIDVLDSKSSFPENRAYLDVLGNVIQDFFGFKQKTIVLSNACVSGILAISVAKRFIKQGKFDHVFIVGGDVLTKFILSGFNSFQALSAEPCKPYDKNRVGINLGEVAAAACITSSKNHLSDEAVMILGDATCNDANHISGPSRTGEGLFRSIQNALKEAHLKPEEIDYISAHGTATVFNDEMEAIAFHRVGLEHCPVNSLKGYFGHTLGASGLLETIIGMHSLHRNILFQSCGFEENGVSKPIRIIQKHEKKPLKTFLKTASGFGGCNTAVVFKKH